MQPSKRKQKHTLTHLTFKAKKLDLRKQTKQKKQIAVVKKHV